jgi:plasmid maintenance system antidote protein VapI
MTTKKKSETLKFLEEMAGRPLTLGGLLESIRLSEEMSQATFAKKLGISSSHLCDIEKGRKVVSPERAARFAEVLGRSREQFVRLSLQELVDEAGVVPVPVPVPVPVFFPSPTPNPTIPIPHALPLYLTHSNLHSWCLISLKTYGFCSRAPTHTLRV